MWFLCHLFSGNLDMLKLSEVSWPSQLSGSTLTCRLRLPNKVQTCMIARAQYPVRTKTGPLAVSCYGDYRCSIRSSVARGNRSWELIRQINTCSLDFVCVSWFCVLHPVHASVFHVSVWVTLVLWCCEVTWLLNTAVDSEHHCVSWRCIYRLSRTPRGLLGGAAHWGDSLCTFSLNKKYVSSLYCHFFT